MSKKAAIVILSYNSLEETTKPCIESIYNCQTNVEFETVAVDNLSSDGTREYLKSIEDQYQNLKIILNNQNYGFAAGNNIGIRSTPADYYILLNSDTIVTDNWLDKIVDFFEGHPEVGLVGPVTNSVGNEQRIYCDKTTEPEIMECGRQWTELCEKDFFYTEMLGFYCVAVKKEVFDAVGYLDEGFGIGMFEDDDFCLRATQKGYKLACLEDVFIYHKGSVSFNKLGENFQPLFFENLKKFEDKHNRKWHTHNNVTAFVGVIKYYQDLMNESNLNKMKAKIDNKLNILGEVFSTEFDINLQYLYVKKYELEKLTDSRLWVFLTYIRAIAKYKGLRGFKHLFRRIFEKIKKKSPENIELLRIIEKEVTNKRVIIFPPPLDWNLPLFQRPQQLAKAYSKKENTVVIYISPRWKYDKFDVAQKVLDSCWLYSEQNLAELNNLLKKAKEVIITLSWTGNKHYLDIIPHQKLIYEYIDDLSVFTGYSADMIKDHEELLGKADVSVATATNLFEDIKNKAQNPILSPNAGDYEFFHTNRDAEVNEILINKIKNYKCVLGYYGSLAKWFDYDLVQAIALKKPDWAWVLVGFDYDGTAKESGILDLPNVFSIEAQPYDKLPSFLQAFTIATLPFKINDITLSTSPVKIFEYMAGGKPVLSANLPECRKYESIFLYQNAEEFVQQAEKILSLDDKDGYWKLLEKDACANTWEARTDQILAAIYKN